MNWIIENWWPLFTALFLVFLLTRLWMNNLARQFVLPPDRVFSILDMQLPPSEKSFILLLRDINKNISVAKKVKQLLLIDFLFMPAAYIGIALLCFKTGIRMTAVGKWLFLFLAGIQLIAWLMDIIENIYLLRKVNRPPANLPDNNTEKSKGYKSFQFIVKTKFIIALTGTVCSVFGLLYYWIVGEYQKESLPWLTGLVVLVLTFFLLAKASKKKAVNSD